MDLYSEVPFTRFCRVLLYLGTSLGSSLASLHAALYLCLQPICMYRDAHLRKCLIRLLYLETGVPSLGPFQGLFAHSCFWFSHLLSRTLGLPLLTLYYCNKHNYRGDNKGRPSCLIARWRTAQNIKNRTGHYVKHLKSSSLKNIDFFHPLIELKLYLNIRLFLYFMLNHLCFLSSCWSFFLPLFSWLPFMLVCVYLAPII